MSKTYIKNQLKEKLDAMEIGDELNKSDIVNELWEEGNGNDCFVRRSFDAILCNVKKQLPEKEFITHKRGYIKRVNPEALVYEDQLPEMTSGQYRKWFKTSKIISGVRMGSPVDKQGNLIKDK